MIPRHFMGLAAIVAVTMTPTAAWAWQQPPVPPTPGTLPPVAQAEVTGCAQAHPMAERTIDMTNRRLEAARQANSPAAMRTAIDDMQAALRQLRAEIAPCAGLQSLAAAEPQAGHVMPSTAQAPAAAPGTSVMRPGSTTPAPGAAAPAMPPPVAAGPHGGHAIPAAPQTPAAAPRAGPAQRPGARAPTAATPRPGRTTPPPGAADPPAGHVMPATPQAPAATAPGRTTPQPRAAAPRTPAPVAAHPAPTQAPAAADAHAGHAMTTPENPAARLADLMCRPQVDPDTAPRATYMGKAYYFCTAADRDLFLKAPAKYLQNR